LQGNLPQKFIHVPRVPPAEFLYWCKEAPVLHMNLYWARRQQMKVWWYSALESLKRCPIPVESRRLYLRSGTGIYRNRQSVPDSLRPMVNDLVASMAVVDTWETWQRDEIVAMLERPGGQHLASAPIWNFPWEAELAARGRTCRVRQNLPGRVLDGWAAKTVGNKGSFLCRIVDAILCRVFPSKVR
jgi:hypothetical protein